MSKTPKAAANVEAERLILAALMQNVSPGTVFEQLTSKDFFISFYAKVFRVIDALREDGQAICFTAVRDNAEWDEMERAELDNLCNPLEIVRATSERDLAAAVGIVRRDSRLRQARKTAEDLVQANGDATGLLLDLKSKIDAYMEAAEQSSGAAPLGSCSTSELFSAQEKDISWLCWPFAAQGLATITDALPKVGKTVFLLRGIHASRRAEPFLSFPTKPMRVVYVSEQSRASLAMQCREIGFAGNEPIQELRWITREDWSRHTYNEFLEKLEKEILEPGHYNTLVIDTLHTVARMEDEKDASEVNKLGNLTIDVATRNNLALALGRHDRKSGGECGISGRSSIQLSGLVDVILHLVRVPNQVTQRKLELLGRVPGLPNDQLIDLVNDVYVNWGEPVTPTEDREAQEATWFAENPEITAPQIVAKFADMSVVISLATAKRDLAKLKQKAKK